MMGNYPDCGFPDCGYPDCGMPNCTGFGEGGGVPTVPHSPTLQWDATSLSEGPLNEWWNTTSTHMWHEQNADMTSPVVTIEGRIGLRIHEDDYTGSLYPQWRCEPDVGVANGLWFIALTFEAPQPPIYRNPLGNQAAANRGLYINAGTMAAELTGAGSTGVRRIQANFDRRADTGSFALGIPDTDVHIMAGYHASRIWNHLGNRTALNTDHMMNGVVHEVLYWADPNILTDEQMDDVTNYLNDKWGFGLTP